MAIIQQASTEDLKRLDDALTDFNILSATQLPRATIEPLDFIVKTTTGQLIGGIQASVINWGILEIHLLFVFSEYRKIGIGSLLLKHVEEIANKKNCALASLATFDFQAKDFYLKQGYAIFGVLENCPKGHRRYYMSKKLH